MHLHETSVLLFAVLAFAMFTHHVTNGQMDGSRISDMRSFADMSESLGELNDINFGGHKSEDREEPAKTTAEVVADSPKKADIAAANTEDKGEGKAERKLLRQVEKRVHRRCKLALKLKGKCTNKIFKGTDSSLALDDA